MLPARFNAVESATPRGHQVGHFRRGGNGQQPAKWDDPRASGTQGATNEQARSLRALEEARAVKLQAALWLQRSAVLLQERKQALITAAVTGQLDITTSENAA